jgi:hypothetical protein
MMSRSKSGLDKCKSLDDVSIKERLDKGKISMMSRSKSSLDKAMCKGLDERVEIPLAKRNASPLRRLSFFAISYTGGPAGDSNPVPPCG